MIRQREKVILAKAVDIGNETYDSMKAYFHNGFQRAIIEPVSPTHPLNGVSGFSDKSNKINYKVTIRNREPIDVNSYILWMDSNMPRLLKIDKIMVSKKSTKHTICYCIEKGYGPHLFEEKTTYGENTEHFYTL